MSELLEQIPLPPIRFVGSEVDLTNPRHIRVLADTIVYYVEKDGCITYPTPGTYELLHQEVIAALASLSVATLFIDVVKI